MPEMSRYPEGAFCWVELATTNAPAARSFYGSLFGWTTHDQPGGAGVYSLLRLGDKDVAALYALGPEQKGVPPNWNSYVSVKSAEETAAKARELGGKVVMGAFDVMDLGRMAVIQDPEGAAFSIWEPRKHIGAQVMGQPDTFCWNELMTRDVQKAKTFYTGLFGWTAKDSPEYIELKPASGDREMAGMLPIRPDMGDMPPHWAVYFAVADCDASIAKAKAGGGKVHMGPHDMPNVGRFAFLEDPQGATFYVIQLKR